MDEEQISELKEMIKLSRKRELNFAMCLGKTHKELVFLLHRIRSQEVLMRKARKVEGALPAKYTIGTVKTKGRKMMMTCSVEPPPGSARVLRRFFIWADMPMKIILLDESGGVVEEDGDDEEDDAPKPSRAGKPRDRSEASDGARTPKPDSFEELEKASSNRIGEQGVSQAMGKWRKARRAVGPKIVAYSKGRTPDAAGIGQSWDTALKLGDKQNKPVEAYRMLERIVSRIKSANGRADETDAGAAVSASKSKQMAEFKALARKMRRRIEAGASPELRKAFVDSVKLAQRGDPEGATELLEGAARSAALR